MTDSPYITFKIDYFQSVICYFSKEEISKISKLNKVVQITIIGNCEDKILTNVILKDCVVGEQ